MKVPRKRTIFSDFLYVEDTLKESMFDLIVDDTYNVNAQAVDVIHEVLCEYSGHLSEKRLAEIIVETVEKSSGVFPIPSTFNDVPNKIENLIDEQRRSDIAEVVADITSCVEGSRFICFGSAEKQNGDEVVSFIAKHFESIFSCFDYENLEIWDENGRITMSMNGYDGAHTIVVRTLTSEGEERLASWKGDSFEIHRILFSDRRFSADIDFAEKALGLPSEEWEEV